MTTATASGISHYHDADLLEVVALRDADLDLAKHAFTSLYRDHAPRLRKVLSPIVGAGIDSPQVEDFLHDTFHRAFARAETFASEPSYPTPDDAHRHVAGWLAAIAQQIAFQSIRIDLPTTDMPPDELARVPDADPKPPGPHHVAALRRLHECLGRLSPKLKAAVLAVYDQLDPGSSRLADGQPERIAHALGTTVPGLRQARSRAERALKKCRDERA